MAQEYSFDVVSRFDRQELVNAIDQARREIGARFDFKGVTAEMDLGDKSLNLLAESEYKLNAVFEILLAKAIKRNLSPKIFDRRKIEQAPRGNVRQEIALREGIDDDLARDLVKKVKAVNPKVQARVQGDTLRVTGRDKDALQGVIAHLRGLDVETPLQFINYR